MLMKNVFEVIEIADNHFSCSHGSHGFCRRFASPCSVNCRYYCDCGECDAYYIPPL